jgi:hypothetical protein
VVDGFAGNVVDAAHCNEYACMKALCSRPMLHLHDEAGFIST